MIACKSLREYNNNQEKIKKFCLEEKRRGKLRQQALIPGPSSIPTSTPTGEQNLYSNEKIVELAKNNQSQQQKTPTTKTENQHHETTTKTTTPTSKTEKVYNATQRTETRKPRKAQTINKAKRILPHQFKGRRTSTNKDPYGEGTKSIFY